jgi:hypothetical protein
VTKKRQYVPRTNRLEPLGETKEEREAEQHREDERIDERVRKNIEEHGA